MSSIGSPSPFFLAGKKAYQVERSLRFNSGDNTYLARTPSSTTSRTTWTYSTWIKKTSFGSTVGLFGVTGSDNNTMTELLFTSGNKFSWQAYSKVYFETSQVFRDPSAWFHLLVRCDTTNSTQADRIQLWINGSRVTSFSTENLTGSGTEFGINRNVSHHIGERPAGTDNFNGYLAEMHFVDGTALDSSSFTETDALTGQLIPKKYTGSYGTNGFYLNFSDNSGTTATTLGKDSSGNGNNFTPNNFSVSAGFDNDSLEDTPTNNFPAFNPIFKNSSGSYEGNASLTNGNLAHSSVGSETNAYATFALPSSGKYYWEVRLSSINTASIGIIVSSGNANRSILFNHNGTIFQDNASAQTGLSSWSGGDIIGIAYNGDSQTLQFYRQGSSQGSALNITAFTESYFPLSRINAYADINFGQRAFSYTPPTGYKALCSANLPDPTIKLPNKHFNTLLYTGDGASSKAITGLNFSPDWVWTKRRSGSDNHMVFDSVRGASTARLFPNLTSAEDGNFGSINSFNSNGFTVGANVGTNANGETFVAWNWNAGDTDGKTYTVKVVSDSGNKYRFDNFGTSAVTLDLAEGGTYIFNMDDSSNASHPFSIGTAANGTVYTSGITYFLDGVSKTYSEYTSGFSAASTRRLHITVPASAPVLYYWCSVHSGMGGQINTNSTLGSSNFDGTVQATVKANPTAGFSIVSYNVPSGSGYSVGHGLGAVPQSILVKNRDTSSNWDVYSVHIGNTKRLKLNSNAAEETQPAFNNQTPTSTVFYGLGGGSWHGVGSKMINYVFSEVAGYSKFGSYEANNSSNGPFVYLGFEPKWIMMKPIDDSGNWQIYDNKRTPINKDDGNALYADLNSAEASGFTIFDFLSNGFKLRNTGAGGINYTNTYIYLAFAESPFKNARAR